MNTGRHTSLAPLLALFIVECLFTSSSKKAALNLSNFDKLSTAMATEDRQLNSAKI